MNLRLIALYAVLMLSVALPAAGEPPRMRIATFNTSLNDDHGKLIERLRNGDDNARRIAATIQHLQPDLILLNEFDYDEAGEAARLFVEHYLGEPQHDQAPIAFPFRYFAPVNTGVPSGLDLDGDGRTDSPEDAWGYGRHPGQYGMLVLSRYPIDASAMRSFRLFRWAALPGARRPHHPDGRPFHPDEVWSQLRLSSKAHWDLPIDTPAGRLHLLVSHPTPPVFDGPENRNGLRNHDEIRFWVEYLSQPDADWLVDDAGQTGGLPQDAAFVIAGDQNADPVDGETVDSVIRLLLEHPRVLRHPAPRSAGAVASAERKGGPNTAQRGDPAEDTGDFNPRAGNLRVDYVLPSGHFELLDSGVFWPLPGEPGSDWLQATDHRAVWLDLRWRAAAAD